MKWLSLRPALLLPVLTSVLLQAAGPDWKKVHTPPGAHFELQYRIYPVESAWFIEFQNIGPQKVHFNYRFPSLQSAKEAASNGRIHLNAIKGRAQLPLPSLDSKATAAALVNLPIRVFNMRVAATDHGGFETE